MIQYIDRLTELAT